MDRDAQRNSNARRRFYSVLLLRGRRGALCSLCRLQPTSDSSDNTSFSILIAGWARTPWNRTRCARHGNMALIRLSGRCDCTLIAPLERCICARHGRSVLGRPSLSQRHSVACGLRWAVVTPCHKQHDDHGKVRKPGHAAVGRNDDAAGAAGCRGMHVKCLD